MKFINKNNVSASFRDYVQRNDKLKPGIRLDSYTEKELCKIVIGNLSIEFTLDDNPSTEKTMGELALYETRTSTASQQSYVMKFRQ